MSDLPGLEVEGVPSTTHKISIHWLHTKSGTMREANIYFHLLWNPVDNCLVGIKMDGLRDFKHMSKALFREYCRELTERLQRKEIDLQYICQRWIVQRFEPAGMCPQINGIALSPLDAAAKFFMARYKIRLDT